VSTNAVRATGRVRRTRGSSPPRGLLRGLRGLGGIAVYHLLFVWALTLLDLQFFLAAMVAQPLVYVVHLGYPPMILMMALNGPALMATAKRWVWYPPLFVLLLVALATLPMAVNKTFAKVSFQYILIYYSMALATAVYIRTPRQAMPIVWMLFGQFAWFAVWAGTRGLVPWHPTLSNYDGFGSMMVQGAGLCYWFGAAATNRRMKMFLYGLAAYCVVGVVASFARAAFLSLIAVVGWIWVRSPRKMATAAGIGVAAVMVVVAASLIFEPGFFVNEIMSAFEEGTEEGTGAQRWELWKVGFQVWAQHPIIGVGGANFGAFAADHFRFGELEAFPNPNMLYGYNLHNAYMQVLSEFGLIGITAFAWALWDFQVRNKQLRDPAAVRHWAERSGGQWKLNYLALGLEAANVANVLGGMFYASLFMPWFYITWIANRMLWALSRPAPENAARPHRRSSVRSRAAPASLPLTDGTPPQEPTERNL
jgi:hypothetical protein